LITGYNGFGGDMENTYKPFDKTPPIDPRWLDTFDTLYCGDPRFSDVPMMNIWRSQDNYSDHQVSAFKAYGMPIRRIDNCAFMIGETGTCYYRGRNCWKGMLILELARGGWVNVYHGNLELLSDDDGKWFATAQGIFHELQKQDDTVTFGEIPGKGKPYGFYSSTKKGAVCTVINPSQEMATIELPSNDSPSHAILYADGGYQPKTDGKNITLGPEQLAVIGFGDYAQSKYNLGVDDTIQIPKTIDKLATNFTIPQKNTIWSKVDVPSGKDVRIIMQQFYKNGDPCRSWPGAPPNGKKISEMIAMMVTSDAKHLPLHIEYDKVIWSGLSWAVAEIKRGTFDPAKPLNIVCESLEPAELILKADVYAVSYV